MAIIMANSGASTGNSVASIGSMELDEQGVLKVTNQLADVGEEGAKLDGYASENYVDEQITSLRTYTDDEISKINTDVDQKISDLVGSAPEKLNALDELSAALNNDENFATTVFNQIGDANTAASNAQTTADGASTAAGNAQTTANEAKTAASTAQTRADSAYTLAEGKSKVTTKTATIGTSWTEDATTGVKSQTVSISGITAENTVLNLDVDYTGDGTSSGYETFVEQQNQFYEYITNGFAETVNGGITFYIFGDPNTINIPIFMEVI